MLDDQPPRYFLGTAPMSLIQWYPGHIAKYEREIKARLVPVDVVVYVLDARLPKATRNQRLEKQIAGKPVLILLNKSDLADPKQSRQWLTTLEQISADVMLYNATAGQGQRETLIKKLIALSEVKMQKLMAKGLKRRPVRVLVAGMPNVGKSSLINHIIGRKKVKTGHKAGVTRTGQWIAIHPQVELCDSPGIIPPILDNPETGALLATVSSVGEAAYEDEAVGAFLLARIEALYPGLVSRYFKLKASDGDDGLSLTVIARSRHYMISGGEPDTQRAAQALLSEFRQGRLGRMTLEHIKN